MIYYAIVGFLLVSTCFALPEPHIPRQNENACLKEKIERAGRNPHTCPEGKEIEDGMCWIPCKKGEDYYVGRYKGSGTTCTHQCDRAYFDLYFICATAYRLVDADASACPWYDKCGLLYNKNCSVCEPHDPPYTKYGCACLQASKVHYHDTYERPEGTPMICSQTEDIINERCYDKCPHGFDAAGKVCWKQDCPTSMPFSKGNVCCKTEKDCEATGNLSVCNF